MIILRYDEHTDRNIGYSVPWGTWLTKDGEVLDIFYPLGNVLKT